jgi:drug/metabolite transporter (DMT)-like permease
VLLPRWDAYTLSLLRYGLATPVMLALLWWRERPRALPTRREWLRLGLLGSVGIGGLATCYTVGLALADPVRAIVIQAGSPVITALVAWLGFRVPREPGLGLGLGLAGAGALLVLWPVSASSARAVVEGAPVGAGEALLLAGSVCWAWYSLGCQRWLAGWSQLRITAWTFVTATAALGGIELGAWAVGATRAPAPDAQDLALLAWLTATGTCLGVFLWNRGVSRLGLPRTAPYLNLVPVVALAITAASGVLPKGLQLVGAGLVLAGVLQAQLRRSGGRGGA